MKEIPIAEVILVKENGCQYWEVMWCPFCSKRHRHGAGELNEDPSEFTGYRGCHCDPEKYDTSKNYELVESNLFIISVKKRKSKLK